MIYALEALVFIESDGDPEDVASQFNAGFERAVRGFPEGEVLDADVTLIRPATTGEIDERGLGEE